MTCPYCGGELQPSGVCPACGAWCDYRMDPYEYWQIQLASAET